MQKDKIRSLVRKYKLISTAWLSAFLLFAIVANWLLVRSAIEHRFDLGLDQIDTNEGAIWIAVIIGLNVVLQLFFYSLEKILLDIYSQDVAE